MLDVKFIRENPDAVKASLRKRGDAEKLAWVDELLAWDARARSLNVDVENLRASRNRLSEKINDLKKAGRDASAAMREAAELPGKVKAAETELDGLRAKLRARLMRLPNVLDAGVPVGKDDSENAVVRAWGEPTKPAFPLKSHVDWLVEHGLADFERAAKISGARFYFLKDELVLLDLALQRFALDWLYDKKFTLLAPPHMMHRKAYEGVTDLADFETVMYKTVSDEDLYLIATSEHPLVAQHQDEILDEKQLPFKYAGISPCYRKEAGAHGKDTKGIFRVHQFNKVEQVVVCRPEDSEEWHEKLLANTEHLFQALEIPYRVVSVCTGDIGTVAAKKYDLEGWFPVQQKYRELASCSNCASYQSVRLNLKMRRADGEKDWPHTLNNTAIATSRAIVAILENHQLEDGRVEVPMALRPYMNGVEVLGKKPWADEARY